MENLLPEEIIIDIFSRAEEVSPLSLVCKTWRRLLRSSEVANMHQHWQLQQLSHDRDHDWCRFSTNIGGVCGGGPSTMVSFLFLAVRNYVETEWCEPSVYYGQYYNECCLSYKKLKKIKIKRKRINRVPMDDDEWSPDAIVGSCNGMSCFSVAWFISSGDNPRHAVNNDPVTILNPITGEEVYLPFFDYNNNGQYQAEVTMASGFGYLPSTNEYKVVRISYSTEEGSMTFVGQVEVYTLGSGRASCSGWRNIGEISSYLLRFNWWEPDFGPSLGVLADGALHWLDLENLRIVAFDLALAEFFIVPSPACVDSNDKCFSYHVTMLGGCLCFVRICQHEPVDIWRLNMKEEKKKSSNRMKEQDDKCFWWTLEYTKAFKGESNVKYEPFALTKTGELLLCYNEIISLSTIRKQQH